MTDRIRGIGAAMEARDALMRLGIEREARQIASRSTSGRRSVTELGKLVAHGYSVGQTVCLTDAGAWTLAIANETAPPAGASALDRDTATITYVHDADTFEVTWWGVALLPFVPAQDHALYVVSNVTPGAVVLATDLLEDEHTFRQAAYYHFTNGKIVVLGPEFRWTHSHKLRQLRDVVGTPTDRQVPLWDVGNQRVFWGAITDLVVASPQPNNVFLGGAASGGGVATPTFRVLADADLPVTGTGIAGVGDSTHVPVISVDIHGRVSALGLATITAAGIGGIPAPSPAPTTKDVLRWDTVGNRWWNEFLGDFTYSAPHTRLDFHTDGIGIDGAVFLSLQQTAVLRWLVRGTEAGGTDKWASLFSPSADLVSLEDDGNTVAEWHTSAVAASRKWSWKMDVEVLGKHLTFDDTADQRFLVDLAGAHYATIGVGASGGAGAYYISYDDNATEVMRWTCDPSTPANRRFSFIGIPLVQTDGGSHEWKWTADTLGRLHLHYLDGFSSLDLFLIDGGALSCSFTTHIGLDSGKAIRFHGGLSTAQITDDGTTTGIAAQAANFTVTNGGRSGRCRADGQFNCFGSDGIDDVVPLAKLTVGGTNGSLTFQGGILIGAVHPT